MPFRKRDDFQESAADFLEAWTRSAVAGDVQAASALRTGGYRCVLPSGQVLTRADELEMIAAEGGGRGLQTLLTAAHREGGRGTIAFDFSVTDANGDRAAFKGKLSLLKQRGVWRAEQFSITDWHVPGPTAARVGPSLAHRIARRLRRPGANAPRFQDLAYNPYRPGLDYALPRSSPAEPVYDEAALPTPPPELWLGYSYPAHGRLHVDAMWECLEAAAFRLADGDRVLDLGCGAGRMIRHLAPLARTCEVWGADISAEHIFWCQRHLSPPFHFVTNTKVPHLPFADGSFRLIYCGSLFTHIDDLTRAWLLELRRLLADDGCAYITIHDEDTVRTFEAYDKAPQVVEHIRSRPMWGQAKGLSDMFTIGRDDRSQVFYARDWFERLLSPMFEVVAVQPNAYFYQTALVVRPRTPPA